jgi:hypothetical protein
MSDPGRKVLDELTQYQKLKALLLQEESDPQAILDTLEGETNLHEALLVVAESALDDEAMAEAISNRVEALQARKSRVENTAEHKRGLIIMAMERAGIQQVKGPAATLATRPLKGKAVIKDESAIPARFWKAQDPKLDKKALNEAIENGEAVEGVERSNGGISLTIRVK